MKQHCDWCGQPLTGRWRSGVATCSARCRKAVSRRRDNLINDLLTATESITRISRALSFKDTNEDALHALQDLAELIEIASST